MKLIGYVASALALLVVTSACDSRTPAGPSSVRPSGTISPEITTPSVAGPGTGNATGVAGQIRLTDVDSGAMLTVRDCSGRLKAKCSEQLRMALEVIADRDMADATVTIEFVDGVRECGRTYISSVALPAATPVSLNARVVYTESEMDEGEGSPRIQVGPFCRLPATTNRVVVKLWRHGDARNPVLTQEFAETFTFAAP